MRRYAEDDAEGLGFKPQYPAYYDPNEAGVEPTDDIENLALGGGLVKAGLSAGLPRLGKMMGLADDAVRGSAPAFATNEVGSIGKNLTPQIEQSLADRSAKASIKALPTEAETLAQREATAAMKSSSTPDTLNMELPSRFKAQSLGDEVAMADTNRLRALIAKENPTLGLQKLPGLTRQELSAKAIADEAANSGASLNEIKKNMERLNSAYDGAKATRLQKLMKR